MIDLHILEKYRFIDAILYIKKHPEGVQKVDLREKAKLSSTTAMKIHKILYDNEIICTLPDPNHHLFILTEKGQEIAQKLIEIKDIMEK